MPATTLDPQWLAMADQAGKLAGLTTRRGGILALANLVGVHRDTIGAYARGKCAVGKPVALLLRQFCLDNGLTIPFEVHQALSKP